MRDPIPVFLVELAGGGFFRMPDGALVTYSDLPIGAAWYLPDRFEPRGPDGKTLAVRVPPGRTWVVDSRCSNCTRPDDKDHRCWVRHGSVEDGTITVDKNGDTCAAGAGSIVVPGWHGFLRAGRLVCA